MRQCGTRSRKSKTTYCTNRPLTKPCGSAPDEAQTSVKAMRNRSHNVEEGWHIHRALCWRKPKTWRPTCARNGLADGATAPSPSGHSE